MGVCVWWWEGDCRGWAQRRNASPRYPRAQIFAARGSEQQAAPAWAVQHPITDHSSRHLLTSHTSHSRDKKYNPKYQRKPVQISEEKCVRWYSTTSTPNSKMTFVSVGCSPPAKFLPDFLCSKNAAGRGSLGPAPGPTYSCLNFQRGVSVSLPLLPRPTNILWIVFTSSNENCKYLLFTYIFKGLRFYSLRIIVLINHYFHLPHQHESI